jgi:hypothetical protein
MAEQTPQEFIREEARRLGVPEALALGVADQESSFNPLAEGQEFELAPGQKSRAYGMYQVIPETAVQYGADPRDPMKSVRDPVENVRIGLRYLKALHDQYGGNLDQVLKTYGGVRTDPSYIPSATAKILQWQRQLDHEQGTGAAGPGASSLALGLTKATGIRPPTWAEQHPWLNAAVQSFDPNEREGRQNYAGWIGGTAGMFLGGPAGSVAGAGLAGALENALIEETGAGDVIARILPGEVNAPPPPPGSTALGRTLESGAWQAGGDLFGQGIAQGAKNVGKRFIQSQVAKDAFRYFAEQKGLAVEKLKNAVEALTEKAAQQTVVRNQAGRQAVADAAAAAEAARVAGGQTVKDVARQGAADVLSARETKSRVLAQARDAAARGIRSARTRAAELLKRNQAQGAAGVAEQAADYAAGMPPRPPFIDAGQAVIDVVEGPAREAYSALGRAVDEAAEQLPDTDITQLYEEAKRIARKQLLGPEHTFPREVPTPGGPPTPPTAPAVSPILDAAGRPQPAAAAAAAPAVDAAVAAVDDDLSQIVAQLTEEERKQLMANPAMHVIGRILNAAKTGLVKPGRDVHLWKSQLQQAIRGTYDAVQRSQAENITMKVAKELRRALAGNEAYDAATAAYEAASPAFTEHVASTIRSVARDSPEAIVDLLNPDRPSHARTLVSLLTEYAEKGGGKEGAAAGRAALQQVRDAYLHKHVFEGGIEGLSERLAGLRARPEFTDALFGGEYKEVFDNLDAIVKAYNDKVVEAASLQTAATMQGKYGVETAADASRAEVEAARQRAEAALQGTRVSAKAARDKAAAEAAERTRQVVAQGKGKVEVARRGKEAERLATAKELREARRAVQTRKAGLGNTPEEIAEREFAESSLGGKNLRRPEQVAADLMHATLTSMGNVWGGLSRARLLIGAKDADIIKYAAHSSARTQAVVAAIKAAKFPGVAATIGAGVKPLRTIRTERQAERRRRQAAAEEEARKRRNPSEQYLNITIR